MKFLTDKSAVSFAEIVGQPFLILPRPPQFFINFIVTIIPWLAGIIGLFSIFNTIVLLPALFGLNSFITQVSGETAVTDWNIVSLVPAFIFTLAVAILYMMAFNPLRTHKLNGWMYLFWANMVGVVSLIWFGILDQNLSIFNVVGLLVGLYITFHIKKEYK